MSSHEMTRALFKKENGKVTPNPPLMKAISGVGNL